MAKKTDTQGLSKHMIRLIWGGLAVLVLLFVSAFSKAWQTNRALKTEVNALRPMATEAMTQQSALETRVVYVQTDEYVEDWAQTRAGMTRSGETLIIPIATTPTPTPVPQVVVIPTPTPTEMPFLSGLWHSLLGD